ncbi:MAG: leucine-rich repeat domain-containing protein [Acholeplasmatales bacterium]|nr:leucine-rich repeat domain-containing protein [Acholeplasmatales bacterium]
MKKKNILILAISIGSTVALLLFLILYFNIPRLHYTYDAATDSYYVDRVYGNASSYTISDEKNSKPVTKILSRTFMDKTGIKRIDLGKNIKVIERMAFLNCTKLESINLENVESIGRNAFENCISLKKIELKIEDVMGGTFIGCKNLKEISLTSTKTIGSYAFSFTAVECITLPETCKNVAEYTFYQCMNLNKIIVLSSSLRDNTYLQSLEGVEFRG